MKLELAESISNSTELDINNVIDAISIPKDVKNGDLSFPCFLLSKSWKISPPECAAKLKSEIKLPELFKKVEVAGPYLNFFLDREKQTKSIITEIFTKKLNYGLKEENSNKTIVIDYSGPNIAKPFHVGHLRTTIIGFALDNIYRHLGYKVVSVNHLGDWGTQFGFVYAGCKLWGKPKEDSVDALVKIYVDANILRKQQDEDKVPEDLKDLPDVNKIAKDYFISLEAGDKEAQEFWKWCLDISLSYLKDIYNKLGIHFDSYAGESFYISMFENTKKMLNEASILEESRGALGIELGEKLGFARLISDDGRSLYLSRDLTTVEYRETEYKPEKILYVVGAPQNLHFQQLKAILEKLSHAASDKVVHIPYGHVPGISTRNMKDKSSSISLSALLEEAEQRALEAYKNGVKQSDDVNEKEVAHSVGLASIYFNYLSRSNIKDFHFNWEEALNFQGDTGPYLLYALARLNSISSKAAKSNITSDINFDPSKINSEECYEIISQLVQFPSILDKVTNDYEPNHLAQFALKLAKTISKAYATLRVLGEDDIEASKARLTLFEASATVLQISIKLLGIPPLKRM